MPTTDLAAAVDTDLALFDVFADYEEGDSFPIDEDRLAHFVLAGKRIADALRRLRPPGARPEPVNTYRIVLTGDLHNPPLRRATDKDDPDECATVEEFASDADERLARWHDKFNEYVAFCEGNCLQGGRG